MNKNKNKKTHLKYDKEKKIPRSAELCSSTKGAQFGHCTAWKLDLLVAHGGKNDPPLPPSKKKKKKLTARPSLANL